MNTVGNGHSGRDSWWRRGLRWEHLALCLLIVITLAFHFGTIMKPNLPVFDETFYVNDAKLIVNHVPDIVPEHPPLGKLFIVSGILLFGDNPFGWRFFSVIFGTIAIVLFYFICRRLMSRRATLLATFLFAFEDMSFVMSGIAMLDVFMLTFMLAGFLLYLRQSYVLSGTAIALSALAKVTGGLALIAILLHWLLTRRDRPKTFTAGMLAAPASFLLFLLPLDYFVSGQWQNPVARTVQLLTLNSQAVFTDVNQPFFASRPWEWLVKPGIMPFYWDPQSYITFISFTVWALIIPAVVYMFFAARRSKNNAAIFGLSWFAATYLAWIPLSLATNRISFLYYFFPTIGAVCLGIGLLLDRILNAKSNRGQLAALVVIFLLAHLAIFMVFYPGFGVPFLFHDPYRS